MGHGDSRNLSFIVNRNWGLVPGWLLILRWTQAGPSVVSFISVGFRGLPGPGF